MNTLSTITPFTSHRISVGIIQPNQLPASAIDVPKIKLKVNLDAESLATG